MDRDEAVRRLGELGWWRAFGWFVPAGELVGAGLEALLAGVEAPSLALLAGLGRREEAEAGALLDAVLEELGLVVELPADPGAAKLELAYWLAGQIADGVLDPARGADLIWTEAALELGCPEELQPIVRCAILIGDWDEHRPVSLEELRGEALNAARELVARRGRVA